MSDAELVVFCWVGVNVVDSDPIDAVKVRVLSQNLLFY